MFVKTVLNTILRFARIVLPAAVLLASFLCPLFSQLGTAVPASRAQIVPPPPHYTFPNGQTYVYAVQWHMFTAGNVTVTLRSDDAKQHVIATAETTGLVSALFKVNDRFEAFFDPEKYCSLHVVKQSEEGSRLRHVELHFDYSSGHSVLEDKNLKTGQIRHAENAIPGCVTDVVSDFYYVSSLPLTEGATYVFPVNDGGKTTDVTARVEGREQVTVPAGTFMTLRVKAEPTMGELKGQGTIWTWYSADENRIPVQMRSQLKWGTLMFRLQRVEK
jgi:hypothetical protein